MQIVKYPIKVKLKKYGEMKYFSQLDVMRILERGLRRAQLPVYCTQGFHPRVKMSFLNGLKLGVEGQIEVIFYFIEDISWLDVSHVLTSQLPQGLEIVQEELT